MPRVSIRTLSRLLIGLTTDDPSDTPSIADELQLVEVMGVNRHAVVPAARPLAAGGSDNFTAGVGVFGIVQVRAAERPIIVVEFESSTTGGDVGVRAGADLISANRAAARQWRVAGGSAFVEHGTSVAAVAAGTFQFIRPSKTYKQEIYLEPGEVVSFHKRTANAALSAEFNWYEIP